MTKQRPKGTKKKLWQRTRDFFQKLPDFLKWIASLIGAIVAVIAAYNQLAPTLNPLWQKYHRTLPPKLIVYVSPDPFVAKSYLSILADTGLPTKYLDTSQIEQLPSLKPGVVIFGGNSGPQFLPRELTESLKRYLRGNVKIIGMGDFGLHVLNTLDTFTLLGDNEARYQRPVLLDRDLPEAIAAGLPTTEPFYLYNDEPDRLGNIVVNDQGSLHLLGAQGIARYDLQQPCKGQFWSIVKYGNYVFWGYDTEVEKLTDEGKRLFANLVKNEQETPYQSRETHREYFTPGYYSGTLGCNIFKVTYPIKVSQEGNIEASVTSDQVLWLVLNGPGQVLYYDRAIDETPRVSNHVTSEKLRLGEDWFVSIYYFGEVTTKTRVEYSVEIDYPYEPVNLRLWLVVGFLGVGLFILAAFGLTRDLKQRRKIVSLKKTN